jgi:hypothetical protein
MPPAKSSTVVKPYERERELAAKAVSEHASEWAAKIGTTATTQFIEDVAEALHACLRAHLAEPNRWRWADVRKDYLRLAENYALLAELLRNWRGSVPPVHSDPRFKNLPPLMAPPAVLTAALALFDAEEFGRAAKAAKRHADACITDKGGPPRYLAFEALAIGLKHAFERAAGRKATITRREDRGGWGGVFFALVEATLLVVRDITATVTSTRQMMVPETAEARGKFLQRLCRK